MDILVLEEIKRLLTRGKKHLVFIRMEATAPKWGRF